MHEDEEVISRDFKQQLRMERLRLSGVQARRSSLSPPEVTISLPPGLITLIPHTCH